MAPAPRTLACAVAGAALFLSPALTPAATADDGDDLSAQQLAQQARDNLLDARSVHLKLTDRGRAVNADRNQPASMDLSLDQQGNCAGTMRMGAHGGTLELIKRGTQVWMKPDTAFWKSQLPGGQGAAVAELFKDRYIHGTTQDAELGGLAGTCDLRNFQNDIGTGPSAGRTALTKGEETTIDGTKVIPLRGRQDGRQATLYVTSSSPHRLAQATQKGRGTDLTLAFTDYDKPVPSATPSPGETVDISKLRQELRNT